MKKRENSGITLIALVVTIVVLLILAGVTIMYVMGDNSIFKQASDVKVKTELAKIEERVSLIYTDKLPNNLNEKPSLGEIVGQLQTEGYEIKTVSTGANAITGISLEKESLSIAPNGTKTIKVTIEENTELVTYYVVVNGKYYKMHPNNGNVTIDRTASEVSDTGDTTTSTLSVSSSDDTVATATANQETKVITITAQEKEDDAIITVTYGSLTPKTFTVTVSNESDWGTIAEIAKAIEEGKALDGTNPVTSNSSEATVGDTTISVGEEFSIYHWTSATEKELLKVRVLGFLQDHIPDADGYDDDDARAGISFEFTEFFTGTHVMNSDCTNNNGWGGNDGNGVSDMRTYLNGTGDAIGGEAAQLKSITSCIKKVSKPYLLGNGSTTLKYSNDWLWLLSCSEVGLPASESGAEYGYAKAKEGDMYKYYGSSSQNRVKNVKGGSAGTWWLRSPAYRGPVNFCIVKTNGSVESANADQIRGVAPGFSI